MGFSDQALTLYAMSVNGDVSRCLVLNNRLGVAPIGGFMFTLSAV